MAAWRFVDVSDEEISTMKENAIPKGFKDAGYGRFANCNKKNRVNCSGDVVDVNTNINENNKLNSPKMFFVQQNGFTNKTKIKTEFESMEVNEMNKCLSKCYVSVTRKDSSFYKKTSLSVGSSGSRPPSEVTASQQKSFILDNRGLV